MEFNFYTNYGAFVRPPYYPEYDFDLDPNLFNLGVNYLDQVAAIWVGSIPGQFCFIRLDGDFNLTASHTTGKIQLFTHNVALSLFTGNVTINENLTVLGSVNAVVKNFDIPHPSKEGYRLRYSSLESPQNDVYIRGRLQNKNEIELPDYWKDFVDIGSISVNITPIGSDQGISVKRVEKDKIVLQSKGNMPIHCFYTVYAERTDVEKLTPEYQGNSPEDYNKNQ